MYKISPDITVITIAMQDKGFICRWSSMNRRCTRLQGVSASEITYIVLGGVLHPTHLLISLYSNNKNTHVNAMYLLIRDVPNSGFRLLSRIRIVL